MMSWSFEDAVFGSFTPPPCSRCGARHFANVVCTYTFAPDASLMVTGEGTSEDASIRRYDALRGMGEAVHEAAAIADAYARLDAALERL